MAHKTLIDGTAYDISGGTTLIEGTVHSIASGKTLIGGTARDISFAPPHPKFVTVTVTGSGMYQGDRWAHIFYRGIMYSEPTVIENIPYGSDLTCYAGAKAGVPSSIDRGTATISVNGEILKSEQATSTFGIGVDYDYALESDVTVELSTTIGRRSSVSSTINIITT